MLWLLSLRLVGVRRRLLPLLLALLMLFTLFLLFNVLSFRSSKIVGLIEHIKSLRLLSSYKYGGGIINVIVTV
jgi:hypothetical protein